MHSYINLGTTRLTTVLCSSANRVTSTKRNAASACQDEYNVHFICWAIFKLFHLQIVLPFVLLPSLAILLVGWFCEAFPFLKYERHFLCKTLTYLSLRRIPLRLLWVHKALLLRTSTGCGTLVSVAMKAANVAETPPGIQSAPTTGRHFFGRKLAPP